MVKGRLQIGDGQSINLMGSHNKCPPSRGSVGGNGAQELVGHLTYCGNKPAGGIYFIGLIYWASRDTRIVL